MFVLCKTHKGSAGALVSGDIYKKVKNNEKIKFKYYRLKYEYLDEVTHKFYLSDIFATAHNVPSEPVQQLPDILPSWMDDLEVECEKCILDALM